MLEYYCGTDIIEVARIENAIKTTKGFKEAVFSEAEIECAEKKGEKIKYQHYAGRFAAKEAIYKAISKINSEITLKQIEILNDGQNKQRPIVNIYDEKVQGVHIDVSISHVKELAISNAIASIYRK